MFGYSQFEAGIISLEQWITLLFILASFTFALLALLFRHKNEYWSSIIAVVSGILAFIDFLILVNGLYVLAVEIMLINLVVIIIAFVKKDKPFAITLSVLSIIPVIIALIVFSSTSEYDTEESLGESISSEDLRVITSQDDQFDLWNEQYTFICLSDPITDHKQNGQ